MTATLIAKHNSSCPSDNHADTIARTTRELEELTNEDLEHLYRRAVAFVMCGKFEAAMEDASTMLSLSPSSALPYLCMGYVYEQQGRYGAAIQAYDEGLQAVSSAQPDYQQQLSKARSTAQSHNDTRVDFIKRLPTHDVIKKIMDHTLPLILPKETTIQTHQLYEYMNVSHVWRERIMQCLPEDLHLELEHHDELAKMDYLLEHAASRVIALTVNCSVTHPQSLLPSISHFSSLRSLCIKKMAHDAPRSMLALLSPMASTLEHLDVRSSDDHDHFSLGDILSTFPQLTWLRCHGNMGDMATTAPTHCPKLKTLLFSMSNHTLQYEHIMDLTTRFPELRQLAIHPCKDTRALTSIPEHCPRLKILYYNSVNHVSSISNLGLESYQQKDGIEALHLGSKSKEPILVDIEDLVSFLKCHHHSLQHLDLRYMLTDASIISFGSLVHDDDDDDDEGTLFESLRSYSQTVYSNEDLLLSRWLIKRSPHLKKVELQEDEDDTTSKYDLGPLFDDLACLDELEDLQVDIGCEKIGNSTSRFLEHHSKIDSLLHTLVFPKNFHVRGEMADLLGSLRRLERLSIQMYDASNLNGIQEGCPQLRHLTIYSVFDLIGFKMALSLASMTNLETLCIRAKKFEYGLMLCLKGLHQLQELTICREHEEGDIEDCVDPPAYFDMLPFTVRILEY